jgi:GntR family transcriptional regulator
MMIRSIDSTHLHLQVRSLLLQEIIQGEFATLDMLPTEMELCERLGVSRTTLRHAVTALEQEGYLRRRQGKGTIIDRNVCAMTARFDLNAEFSDLLRDLGYTPRVQFFASEEEPADPERARLLKVSENSPLLSINKLWLADEKPAIWCVDSIPTSLINKPYSDELLREDIFFFLRETGGHVVSYLIANLFPRRLGEELGQLMGIDANEPVIASNAIGYNPNGLPVLYTSEVYAPGIVTHSVLRAKI